MNTAAIRSVAALVMVTGISGSVQAQFRLRRIGGRLGCYQPRVVDTRHVPHRSIVVPEKAIPNLSSQSATKSELSQSQDHSVLKQNNSDSEPSQRAVHEDSQEETSNKKRGERRRHKRERSKQDIDRKVIDQTPTGQPSPSNLDLGTMMEYFWGSGDERPDVKQSDESDSDSQDHPKELSERVENSSSIDKRADKGKVQRGKSRDQLRPQPPEIGPKDFRSDGPSNSLMVTPQNVPGRSEIVSGSTVTVFSNFLQQSPGAVLLTVENVTVACEVVMWQSQSVTFDLPALGATRARPAFLRVVLPNGRVAKTVEVLLVPPPTCVIHSETVGQPSFSGAFGSNLGGYAHTTTGIPPACEYAH